MAAGELDCPKCGLHMGGRAPTMWTNRARWGCTKCRSTLQFSMWRRMRNKTICMVVCIATYILLRFLLRDVQDPMAFVVCGGVGAAVLLGFFLPGKIELVEL